MSGRQRVGTPTWVTLEPDERVWLHVHPSKNVLLVTFGVGTGLLLAVGGLALAFDIAIATARLLSTVVLVFIFGLTGVVYLLTRRLAYAASTHRAYRAVGLTSKDVESVDFADVTDVSVVQAGWQRCLNVGDIRLHADGDEPVRFRYIEHPEWVRERLLEMLEGVC